MTTPNTIEKAALVWEPTGAIIIHPTANVHPELLPCPFCGEIPHRGVVGKSTHFVECRNDYGCPACPMVGGSDLAAATAHWNQRKGGNAQ